MSLQVYSEIYTLFIKNSFCSFAVEYFEDDDNDSEAVEYSYSVGALNGCYQSAHIWNFLQDSSYDVFFSYLPMILAVVVISLRREDQLVVEGAYFHHPV